MFYRSQDLTEIWKEVDPSSNDFHYLTISGPGKFKLDSDQNFGNKEFWNELYNSSEEFNDFEKNTSRNSTINDQKDEL